MKTEMSYAGFWKRLAAAILDGIITGIVGAVVAFMVGSTMGFSGDELVAVTQLLGVIINWVYWAGMESSSTQGTLGKMALGIKVTDLEGKPISFGKASGRHFGKILSSMILFIGFIMAAFTQKKQGLHDMMAECLVVNR